MRTLYAFKVVSYFHGTIAGFTTQAYAEAFASQQMAICKTPGEFMDVLTKGSKGKRKLLKRYSIGGVNIAYY